jgi:hypothetical protein
VIYRILHRLFGWDYIHWQNSADSAIARINRLPDGKIYYWRYKITRVMDIISEPNQVRWLTCKPDKYLEVKK